MTPLKLTKEQKDLIINQFSTPENRCWVFDDKPDRAPEIWSQVARPIRLDEIDWIANLIGTREILVVSDAAGIGLVLGTFEKPKPL